MARSLLEQFYSNDKMNINPLKEGMYSGEPCPHCGEPMDDEGYHSRKCSANNKQITGAGTSANLKGPISTDYTGEIGDDNIPFEEDAEEDIDDAPKSNAKLDEVIYFLKNMSSDANDRKNEQRTQEDAYLWNDVRFKLDQLAQSYEKMQKTEETEEAFAPPATDLNAPTTF